MTQTDKAKTGSSVDPLRLHEETRDDSGLTFGKAGRGRARHAITFVYVLLASIGAVCSWLLYRWYGVFEHRDHIHFAFQKLDGGFDNPVLRQTLAVFLVLGGVYVAVLWLLWRSDRMTPWRTASLILLVSAMGLGSILLYPVGALDVFNYMVELKLAYHYDQNPYVVTFEAYREMDPYALPAFLVDVTLFYGPAWLLVSWIPVAVTGFSDVIQTLIGMKIFNLVLLVITALLIARYRKGARGRWYAAAVFLANPLVMFEGVGNAHNDVLLTVFLVAALMALQRRSPLAGPLLALSALVKLYTVVLVPLFVVVALKDRWGWRRIATTVLVTLITVVIACAPFWGEGRLIDGLRSGLEESQGMDHVSPYSLAQQHEQLQIAERRFDTELVMSRPAHEILPDDVQDELRRDFAAILVVASLMLAASAWMGREPTVVAAETILVLFLTTTNLYGWYLIPVFALLAMRPDRASMRYVATATMLGLAYYPMFVYAHFNTEWTRFEVHQFLALFLTVPILLYFAGRLLGGAWAALSRKVTSRAERLRPAQS